MSLSWRLSAHPRAILYRVTRFPCSEQKCRCFSSTYYDIHKILIANRGEIACRIIRTARKMGIKTVAVYSDADKDSVHVRMADEAYNIGPPPSDQSYLRHDKIISVAKKTQSQAIHPGYGFLSENAEFAELCQNERVIFIGPPASAIRDMGIKSKSKKIMEKAQVPVIPGYHGDGQSMEELQKEASQIGFPIMIKAVRGGGGKGMRISRSPKDFEYDVNSAKTEALKAVGDDLILLEKYIENPRHVEVQVFADQHGNCVYLNERDCSVQRRHQKVIEEAPAPGLDPAIREQLGQTAVEAAKAVQYVGAGTVEFVMDRQKKFYFMEMNTRLQVEHPITEMITGVDLVEWQILVASGQKLPKNQSEIPCNGHAFEARVYAEDPDSNFLPGAGRILQLSTPSPSETVRVEMGVREGDEVSVYYDPMIAKLAVWGKDRIQALRLLYGNLANFNVVGLITNVNFLMRLASHPSFERGDVHTGFIPDHYDELFPKLNVRDSTVCQAAAAIIANEQREAEIETGAVSPFNRLDGFRINHQHGRTFQLLVKDLNISVRVTYLPRGKFQLQIGEKLYQVSSSVSWKENFVHLETSIDGKVYKCLASVLNDSVNVFTDREGVEFKIPTPSYAAAASGAAASDGAVSPIPGVIERVLVQPGDAVKQGDPLVVMIAMKMEYTIRAPKAAVVAEILCKQGTNVGKNVVLIKFEDVVEEAAAQNVNT